MGQFAEIIYFVDPITGIPNPQDEFDPLDPPPTPHLVRNSLTDVAPDAGFAMGNRYEIGYRDQGHGWLLGVLDARLEERARTDYERWVKVVKESNIRIE